MRRLGLLTVAGAVVALGSASLAAQWPKTADPTLPRDAKGAVRGDAPAPRTPDGKPDLSGLWMATFAPIGGRGRAGGPPGANNAFFAPGGVVVELPAAPFPVDPGGPPRAAFFDAGANLEGGLPLTPWAAEIKKTRVDLQSRDNPDANCLPMGFLQFHQQPQPRRMMNVSNPRMLLIEYEGNHGLRHIYLDGRTLPPQGDPQPWWYGYSVGRWEGETLVVDTNNLRGAEDGPFDGWLDVNGSPYSEQAKFTEKFRRPSFDHLQIDLTLEDPKAYTKPWTVRVDQRLLADQELIEFECNENQQFRRKIKID